MPTAWDRAIPPDDKNPLVGLPDYKTTTPPGTSTTPGTPGVPPASQTVGNANWLGGLLGLFQPVPQVQAASVVDTNPNLLLQNRFSDVESIGNPGQGWVWDHSLGHGTVGTARATATGVIKELVSNQIHVVGNQKMNMSVWARWEDLVYTGTDPIVLGVTRYKNGAEVGDEDLVKVETPAATADWNMLAYNNYVAKFDCDEIRLRLKIAANLTAGTVWFDDAEVIKSQPGSGYIGSVVDTVVNGLENTAQQPAGGWDLFSLLFSMFNQFTTTVDHATRIAYLEGLQSTGNTINDEFLRTGADLGANWHQTYTGAGAGTWATNGDFAYWVPVGVGDREVFCRYIGTPSETLTDKQKIIAVLGSKGDSFGGIASNSYLYGRMDSGETNWIRLDFPSIGGAKITRSLGGVVTDLATQLPYDPFTDLGVRAPGAGATIALICGTAAGDRFFEGQVNGQTVITASDATSNVGASYRGYGHGAKATGSVTLFIFGGQNQPPMLNAWAAIDN